LSIHALVAKI